VRHPHENPGILRSPNSIARKEKRAGETPALHDFHEALFLGAGGGGVGFGVAAADFGRNLCQSLYEPKTASSDEPSGAISCSNWKSLARQPRTGLELMDVSIARNPCC
jgi:hypothetical protein